MKNRIEQSVIALLERQDGGIRVRNAGKFRFPKNYQFGAHSHIEVEMNYITSGSCIMGVGEEYISLKQGECIIIPAWTPHCFMVDVRKACGIIQLEYKISKEEGKEGWRKVRDCPALGSAMENICRCFREEKPVRYKESQMDFAFAQLFVELQYDLEEKQPDESWCLSPKMKDVLNHINSHYETNLNLEDTARDYGISSRNIRKYFEKHMGMKCQEYITMLRIEKAKELLWNSEMSITEIALGVGYASSQYFSSVFGRYTGMTPRQFRNSWTGRKAKEDYSNE